MHMMFFVVGLDPLVDATNGCQMMKGLLSSVGVHVSKSSWEVFM